MNSTWLPIVLVAVAIVIGAVAFRFAWRLTSAASGENRRVRDVQKSLPPQDPAKSDDEE